MKDKITDEQLNKLQEFLKNGNIEVFMKNKYNEKTEELINSMSKIDVKLLNEPYYL